MSISTEYSNRYPEVNSYRNEDGNYSCYMGETTFGARLRQRRERLRMTQGELGMRAGLTQETISNIESGRNRGSRHTAKLAAALRCRALWLETGRGPEDDENNMANVVEAPRAKYHVPEISWVAAGGFNEANDPYAPGAAARLVDTEVPVSQQAIALVVRGDSMEPEFPDGCTIIVDPAERPKNGSYVVVRSQDWDEATFKQYRVDAGIKWLVPLNPKYQAVQAPYNSAIVGVVVEMIPARKRFR